MHRRLSSQSATHSSSISGLPRCRANREVGVISDCLHARVPDRLLDSVRGIERRNSCGCQYSACTWVLLHPVDCRIRPQCQHNSFDWNHHYQVSREWVSQCYCCCSTVNSLLLHRESWSLPRRLSLSVPTPRRIFVRLALLPSHLKLTLEIMSFFTKHSYSSDRCRCCYSRFSVFVVVVFLFSIFFFCTFCLLPFNALQLVDSLLLPFAIQSSVVPGGDDDGDDN